MNLNTYWFKCLALVFVLAAAPVAHYVTAQPSEQVIAVVAEKFQYMPGEIRLKKGVPVVLEFTTRDVTMGFSAPDLGVRADIVPGRSRAYAWCRTRRAHSGFTATSSAAAATRR